MLALYNTPVEHLRAAIDQCLVDWGDDPAYREPTRLLKQVKIDLDSILSSPGHRAALRVQPNVQSGQERMTPIGG